MDTVVMATKPDENHSSEEGSDEGMVWTCMYYTHYIIMHTHVATILSASEIVTFNLSIVGQTYRSPTANARNGRMFATGQKPKSEYVSPDSM